MTDIDMDAVIAELRKGWTQAGIGDLAGDGPVCLIGAVNRACGVREMPNDYETEPTLWAAARLTPIILDQFGDRIEAWNATPIDAMWAFNDDGATTLDDVILVCEKARAAQGEVRHD